MKYRQSTSLQLMRARQDAAKNPSKRMIQATQNFYAAARDMPQGPVAKERAKAVHWEHIEQIEVIKWWRRHCENYGLAEIALYAVPNSGRRSKALGAYMQAEGLRRGAPDLILDVASKIHHGLRIELKRVDGGVQSDEQKSYQEYYATAGIRYELCHGADVAIACIKEYLA